MNFRQALPADLYRQATTKFPYQFHDWATHETARSGVVVGGEAAERTAERVGEERVAGERVGGKVGGSGGGWSVCVDQSCGPMTRMAVTDLIAFMKVTFNVKLARARQHTDQQIRITNTSTHTKKSEHEEAKDEPGERYTRVVKANAITIEADSDESGSRAIFHMQRQMLMARGPVLKPGRITRDAKWKLRITYPLARVPMDNPEDFLAYPDSYLLNMMRHGYNAMYIYLDVFDFMSPKVEPHLARPGYRHRVEQLQRAAARLARFGIRLLMHANTLALPNDHQLFQKYPTMRGAVSWHEGRNCLCSGSRDVVALYRDWSQRLFTDAPDLGGAVLVVGGECFLHCFSRPSPRPKSGTHCSRCAKLGPARVVSDVVNAVARGAQQAKPDAKVFAWQYSGFVWGDQATQKQVIARLDPSVTVLETFAKDQWVEIEGVSSYVFDYTISQLGPAPRFTALNNAARKTGHEVFAKTEASQSIEMWNLPRIPIMDRWADRAQAMRDAEVAGVHTTWRFFGFCGQMTDDVLDYFAWEPKPNKQTLLRNIAVRDFGHDASVLVLKAWRQFSRAFAHWPYSGGTTGFPYFRGPFSLGPAHPMVFDTLAPARLSSRFYQIDPSTLEMSREVDPNIHHSEPRYFSDLTWTQPFGPAATRHALLRVERGWQKGVQQLQQAMALAKGGDHERLSNELDLGRIMWIILNTAINLADLQMTRLQVTVSPCTPKKLIEICRQAQAVIQRERDNAAQALPLLKRHGSFGYGSAYGRTFDADLLQEKLDHCDDQLKRVIPAYYHTYAFHMFADARRLDEV